MMNVSIPGLSRSGLLGLAAVVSLAACAPASDEAAKSAALGDVTSGDHRPESEVARDRYRHPQETLEFFGLRPDSVVVELWPSGGWYTKVIAPAVRDEGIYYAAHFDPDAKVEMLRKSLDGFKELLVSRPDLYDQVQITTLAPPAKTEIAPAGTADLVVSFRSVHNWMAFGMQDDVMAAVYTALKPGGAFGVVEHRGVAGTEQDPKAQSGYVTEAYMIELAEKAGLVLDSASEINANPADTKDYASGVWALPPRLKDGEENRAKYLEIGESDRFTLLFRKPEAP